MRVVAGVARGRRLVSPNTRAVRPTSDRVREAIFNALGSLGVLEGARVLDLFAGTGALGIEALSRGAASCVFVDEQRASIDLTTRNLAGTGLEDVGESRLVRMEALAFLGRCDDDSFDLVLVDPPYAFDEWADLWLSLSDRVTTGGVVVVESDRPIVGPEGWMISKSKHYGGTVVNIHVRTTHPPEPAQ